MMHHLLAEPKPLRTAHLTRGRVRPQGGRFTCPFKASMHKRHAFNSKKTGSLVTCCYPGQGASAKPVGMLFAGKIALDPRLERGSTACSWVAKLALIHRSTCGILNPKP